MAASTKRPGADTDLGSFGGLFDLKKAGYRDPLLVACTDGVGTKLLVAAASQVYDTVGIDLVAMCVNDLVVQGAEPLFFLDYFATGCLDLDSASGIIDGIAGGCREAGCALIGGETAEMPDLYVGNEYDLSGFAVGAVERDRVLPNLTAITAGDLIVGLRSSGFHANGYSLIRKVLSSKNLFLSQPAPFDPKVSLGQALLVPTRIYVKQCLKLHRAGLVKAFAHITGGGFIENIPRVLPQGLAGEIEAKSIPLPNMMKWFGELGSISPLEMARTFNCGIGMIAIVSESNVAKARKALEELDDDAIVLGRIVTTDTNEQVVYKDVDALRARK